MEIRDLKKWVEQARSLGDMLDEDIISAAESYCWFLYDQHGQARNGMAILGIKWLSALMVSSIKTGSDPLSALNAPARIRKIMITREAMRHNNGALRELLREAAGVSDRLLDTAMFEARILQRIAPTGPGKGSGTIRK